MLRWLDWPPVWLAGFVALAWVMAMPVFEGAAARGLFWAGVVIGLGGTALMGLAALAMVRARTTIVPRQAPSALVTGGVFALSRNPIYLGDLMILAGLSLIWQSWLGLVLVPVLGRVLAVRFIEGEEARLRAAFGAEAEAWMARVRRWL